MTGNIEVLNLANPAAVCEDLPDFPISTDETLAGISSNSLVVCGGNELGSRCFSLGNDKPRMWAESYKMSTDRVSAASVQLGDSMMVIGGVPGTNRGNTSTPEVLTADGWKNMPTMPLKSVWWHCAVNINQSRILIIGGVPNVSLFYNIKTQLWYEGPKLKRSKWKAACGWDSGTNSVILADDNSVEILNLNDVPPQWKPGPDLPVPISNSAMITDPTDGSLVVIGGRNSENNKAMNTLMKLKRIYTNRGDNYVWEIMDQELKIARSKHFAILVPDNIVSCNGCTSNRSINISMQIITIFLFLLWIF